MKFFDYFKSKKKKDLPLIARVDLTELAKQREAEMQDRDVSILASADYTKRIPTIRLMYVALSKYQAYGSDEYKVGQSYGISSPFRLPADMSMEDACKVVSYLSEKVERENPVEPASNNSVALTSHLLEKYGFSKVETNEKGYHHAVSKYSTSGKIKLPFHACEEIEGVTDLMTVGGDFKLFKRTDLSNRYFDWFTEGVKYEEIEDIYKKINQNYILEDLQDDIPSFN